MLAVTAAEKNCLQTIVWKAFGIASVQSSDRATHDLIC